MHRLSAKTTRASLAGAVIAGALSLVLLLAGCSASDRPAGTGTASSSSETTTQATPQATTVDDVAGTSSASFDYASVPTFDGTASVEINGNVPYFTNDDIAYAESNPGFESYGAQDALSRCTTCWASVGAETMPADGEERGEIGMVKPTGWKTVRYDSVEGRYLYNRCHLLGWQLTDENANTANLITGTRFMNVDGMLPHENDVASYVRRTGNHVLYRVTPVFEGDELVARGVLMEARSVEDSGAGLSFCYWAYNAQPGIAIDYADGSSAEMAALPTAGESSASLEAASAASSSEQAKNYVLNTNSGKFHLPTCEAVAKMSDSNKKQLESTRESMIAQGYEPCGKCNP